jgi:hypothetical protein
MQPNRSALCAAILFAFAVTAAPAHAAGPAPGFQIESDYSIKSPDGQSVVEQFKRNDKENDGGLDWEFWVRRGDVQTLLNTEGDIEYPADFRFTNDSRWLVRTQKTGSGEQSLFLYKLGDHGFVSATKKPIGDLAWAYFRSRPESKTARKPDFHMGAGLIKGTDENYRGLGVNWPENRYIVISLWGEVEPNEHHHQLNSVRGWRMRYDLEAGKFDVPPEFAKNNAEALDRKGE